MANSSSIDTKTRLRIAAHLRLRMEEMKLSKREAAKLIGVDEATVGRVVNYSSPVGLDLVLGMIRALHIDANRLFDIDPPPKYFTGPEV